MYKTGREGKKSEEEEEEEQEIKKTNLPPTTTTTRRTSSNFIRRTLPLDPKLKTIISTKRRAPQCQATHIPSSTKPKHLRRQPSACQQNLFLLILQISILRHNHHNGHTQPHTTLSPPRNN